MKYVFKFSAAIFGGILIDGDCSMDDYCDDTPSSNGPNYSCMARMSCGSSDMIENYMEDSCMSIFTQDQKDRMLQV